MTFWVMACDEPADDDRDSSVPSDTDQSLEVDTTLDEVPGTTSGPIVRLAFSAEVPAGAAVTFECSTDDAPFAACTSPATLTDLSDGGHTFAVRAVARLGAASAVDPTPATITWNVDATPPTLQITRTSPALARDVTFQISVDDDAILTCALDDATPTACGSTPMFHGLSIDAHNLTVTAEDDVGNTTVAEHDWTIRPGPVQLAGGDSHTCVLLNTGEVKCWGSNVYGAAGLGSIVIVGDQAGEMGSALTPVDLGSGRTATTLAAGRNHTCAILDDGALKCWGKNEWGDLGLGDEEPRGDGPGEMGDALPAIDLGSGRTAVALALGSAHTCALLDDGSVKCWGESLPLGDGDHGTRGDESDELGDSLPPVLLGTGRTARAIAAGAEHTCAILDDETVKCWGITGIHHQVFGISDIDDMGDALPTVDLGLGRTARAMSAGAYHTCVLLDDASVKCWGENESGQLGRGTTEAYGQGEGEMGDDLAAIDLGTGRSTVAIHAATGRTCAVLDDATVKCWGANSLGQLGLGDTAARGDEPDELGNSLPAVDLGPGRTVKSLAVMAFHTCAILDDDSVRCWGTNHHGQLGRGGPWSHGAGPGEMGVNLPPVEL